MSKFWLCCCVLVVAFATPIVLADEEDTAVDADGLNEMSMGCNIEPVAEANRKLSYELYGVTARIKPNQNLFFAPTTIGMSLAMVLAGARGGTRRQIWRGLQYNVTKDSVEENVPCLLMMYNDELLRASLENKKKEERENDVEGGDDDSEDDDEEEGAIVFKTAGRIFGEQTYMFNQTFVEKTSQYGSQMQMMDFATEPEESRHTINKWVANRTEGKIPELFKHGDIKGTTKLVITSAIYFKGLWEIPFDEDDNFNGIFTVKEGVEVNATYMRHQDKYRMHFDMMATFIELPYKRDENGRSDVSMIIIKPTDSIRDVEDLLLSEEKLGGEGGIITRLLSKEPIEANIILPKFKVEAEYNLKPVLRKLGVKSLFNPARADLSGMMHSNSSDRRPLYVSTAVHKTFLEVDEKGTEAAGATGLGIVALSLPPQVFCNSPFVVIIYEKMTNGILFIGRISDPSA